MAAVAEVGSLGGFGTGDALDGAVAEFLRMLGQALLRRIGQEGRDFGAAGRQRADGKTKKRAADPGPE
jgi:hypothetical protein